MNDGKATFKVRGWVPIEIAHHPAWREGVCAEWRSEAEAAGGGDAESPTVDVWTDLERYGPDVPPRPTEYLYTVRGRVRPMTPEAQRAAWPPDDVDKGDIRQETR